MENINIDNSHGFQKLTPVEGYLITNYKDGIDDIKTYYSTIEVDTPMNADISIYHTVTLEEDSKYKIEKAKAYKESDHVGQIN